MIHNKYFEVMKEFLKGYFKEVYGRGLIKNVKISQKNISNTLISLEEEGILRSTFDGNRRYYSLNFENPLIEEYLVLYERLCKILFLKTNISLIDFSKNVLGDIVCVFGSYAKGKNTKNSDLDLLVVGGENSEILKLGKEYGLDLQIFNISLKDFRKGFGENLVLNECLKNHIILKGEDLFVKEVLKWKS